jgi:NADPH:quinone reductase-like Zn-dependent oxidoreductase
MMAEVTVTLLYVDNNRERTLKAVICPVYGPPEVLKLSEVEPPVPTTNEILVKVRATSVTVADVRVRGFNIPASYRLPARFMLGFRRPKKPVLGAELAGEVVGTGTSVTRFKTGDLIFAATPLANFGAYAEYICLPENGPVALKPSNISFEEAAVVPIGGVTALHYLRKAKLRPGQKMLIYGASGSVGTYAVQLAKVFGAHVTAVCSGANGALVRSLGADIVLDYTEENFTSKLEKYDVILIAVDKLPFSVCNNALKENGVYLNVTAPVPSFAMIRTKMTSKKTIVVGENAPETPELIEELRGYLASGKLKPVIDRTYPLEQIVDAHRYVDTGRKRGNVVITL